MSTRDPRYSTVTDRLVERAARRPDAPLLRFYDGKGRVQTALSQADAVAAMRAMSGFLTTRCGLAPGDVALLVYPPSLDFAVALLGCMYAGVVPAPVYPPNPFKLEEGLETFEPIRQNCGARVALTNRLYARSRRLGRVRSFVRGREGAGQGLEWIATDKVKPGRFDAAPGPAVGPDTLALLQYTSGSTSAPKGVMITHGNLEHQLDFNRDHLAMGPESRMVAWVPQYHDFGLISGILSATAGNGEFHAFSPLAFIEDPGLWFELITREQATHIAGPNFGYELAVRKTTPEQRAGWDLSRIVVAMSAAEPVRASTVDRFGDAFAPCGFRPEAFNPAYGLAEHTVGVTVSGRGRLRVDRAALARGRVVEAAPGVEALTLMGCGRPQGDIAVAIVEPDDETRLPADRVGEIWCDSGSKAAGYLGQPELSQATFEARIRGESGRAWLRTGDMGFLHDGELYICGRLKDMLILQGRNLYAQDVEDAARAAHPLIRPGGLAAFVIDHIGEDAPDALVLYVECKGARPTPEVAREVAAAAQKAVRATCEVGCGTIVVGTRGLVRKTTSGKVRRRACKAAWRAGERAAVWHVEDFDAEHAPAPLSEAAAPAALDEDPDSIAAAIRRSAAALLGLPGPAHIDPVRPLFTQGLSSVLAVDLCSALGEWLERPVPVTLLFRYPSVEALAAHLSDDGDAAEAEDDAVDPALELTTGDRVIVVGGGAAGLTVARTLLDKGCAVVLLEAEDAVGGKVTGTRVDGRYYELGQIFFFTGYSHTLARITALDVDLKPGELDNHVLAPDGSATPIANTETADWCHATLEAAGFRPDQAAGLEDMPADVCAPFGAWLREKDLLPMPPGVAYLWTSFGYGRLGDDIPAFYFLTIANTMSRNGVHVATLGERNVDLWDAEAKHLLGRDGFELRTGARVEAVEGGTSPAVRLAGGEIVSADAVVVATPPGPAARMLPADHPAVELLGRFRTFDYVVTLADIEADHWPDHAVLMHNLGPERAGHMMSYQRPYGTAGLVHLSQYGQTADGALIDDATLEARLRADVEAAGGKLRRIHTRRRWTYFPHLPSAEVAEVGRGLYAAQGADGIMLAGAYLNLEAIEHTIARSEALVRRRVAVRPAAPTIADVLADPVFGAAARVARDPATPTAPLTVGEWVVRPATPADDVEVDRLDREEYGWLGEDAVEGVESIRHQIALLNGGDDKWLWVLERAGRLVAWYVLMPTAVDPKGFSSWAEATDAGRLTGTFDPAGRNLYLVAAGVSGDQPKIAHELLILGALRMMRARGMQAVFCCLAMPGFASAHAATGVEPEDYMRQIGDDGAPVDPMMAVFRSIWPGEHHPPRLLRDGYPPDRFSGGHGVGTVVDIADPAAAIDEVLLHLMRRRDALGV